MAKTTILVVEDDTDILELIRYNLEKEGFTVISATSGETALRILSETHLDAAVLDRMLPDTDGMEILRRLRRNGGQNTDIPVIMATARGEDTDVISGLELGADDYVTKPFSPKVLVARLRKQLRAQKEQSENANATLLQAGGLTVDSVRHRVFSEKQEYDLSATEFAILELLIKKPGWVFSRNKIIDSVKGENYPVTERSVDVQILGLRKKLEDFGDFIQTVRGVGYRFKEER